MPSRMVRLLGGRRENDRHAWSQPPPRRRGWALGHPHDCGTTAARGLAARAPGFLRHRVYGGNACHARLCSRRCTA